MLDTEPHFPSSSRANASGVERLIELTGPTENGLTGGDLPDLIAALRRGDTSPLAATDGHFTAVARDGDTVRLARTLGAPLRYFVAKAVSGPFLLVAERMDDIYGWCCQHGIAWQFEPAYTRMVPAHHVVTLRQIGCPDPNPTYRRFFEPACATGPADPEALGARYVETALAALRRWLTRRPAEAPVGVAFSGGIDSTTIWILARRAMRDLGRNPDAVRAFTLDLGNAPAARQAREVAQTLGLIDTWEVVTPSCHALDYHEAMRVIEDYQPLDVACAAAGLALLRAVRARHPHLDAMLDGDGGDENWKSYPLEDSSLTMRSVLRNPLLYHEGWGVDAIKHSLCYSGGLSRGSVRTVAPARETGFDAFSPFTMRSVIAASLAAPFSKLCPDAASLYALKGSVCAAGVRKVCEVTLPLYPKQRFQDGVGGVARPLPDRTVLRAAFNAMWGDRRADR